MTITLKRLDDVVDGNPLGTRLPFVVEGADGTVVAQGELLERSWMGDGTGRLLNMRWEPGQVEAARHVVEAAVAAAGPGQVLNAATNADFHPDPAERIALLESCGFELWQEKEGFRWADAGLDLPPAEGLTARPLAEIGEERSATLLADCSVGTLDRIDADAMAAMGALAWATARLRDHADATWLLAENPAGEAVGFVGVEEFDPGVGSIPYIGVLPGHRGRGHVDALLRLANLTARERGFHAVLSDTDMLNIPMQQAFRRNGHSAEATAWHKWMHRREA